MLLKVQIVLNRNEKIFIAFKSELDWSVVEVHGLISGWRLGVITGLTCV